jgi:hypothetical protein
MGEQVTQSGLDGGNDVWSWGANQRIQSEAYTGNDRALQVLSKM